MCISINYDCDGIVRKNLNYFWLIYRNRYEIDIYYDEIIHNKKSLIFIIK